MFTVILRKFNHISSATMVGAIPEEKALASGANIEKGQFYSFASRKTRDCRKHCSAAIHTEELVLLFK